MFGIFIIRLILLLLFAGPFLPAQVPSAAAKNDNASVSQDSKKFSTALEAQISCEQALDPAKAIGALQRAGVIKRRSYFEVDSLNYFRARKPLAVWGFRVASVFGFAQNSRIFERGPGTAPPTTLGVVVFYSVARVKTKLSSLGLGKVRVERAQELDVFPRRTRPRVLTEIYCEGQL